MEIDAIYFAEERNTCPERSRGVIESCGDGAFGGEDDRVIPCSFLPIARKEMATLVEVVFPLLLGKDFSLEEYFLKFLNQIVCFKLLSCLP